jgi:MFS family permease
MAPVFIFALYEVFGLSIGIGDLFLATVGSVASITNCLGRIAFGIVADKASFKFAMVFIIGIMTVFMLTIYACSLGGRELYLIWVNVISFCIGGGFSVIPTALARAYGVQYASENYGQFWFGDCFPYHLAHSCSPHGICLAFHCFQWTQWSGIFDGIAVQAKAV